jgi:hypothetical protein
VFEPVAAHRDVYDNLYKRVYKKMYANLQPMYREIAQITGYPQQI